jgi:AcrR family transcriptional regulator
MSNPVTALKPRRTQEERSAATRTRLLDATIECLFELGYAGTTTTVIAERAGVSRGAQLHHFPTKSELVTTAVEHILERRLREFREAFAKIPAGVDRDDAAIDILWSMVSGPTFYAWLELLVAARTDADLRAKMGEIGRRFFDNVELTYQELFPLPEDASAFAKVAPHFTFALLEGLALDAISHPNDPHHVQVLEALKLLARLVRPHS